MTALSLFLILGAYFLLLFALSWVTSRKADNDSFFIGNRDSNWLLVAFGMVGTALSGVTFISVPGTVGSNGFGYMQVVLGNWIGFILVAFVLLPLYYRLRLTSLYSYLGQRFGLPAQKTGSALFIVSRTVGATARLYLVINVLDFLIGGKLGISFMGMTIIVLAMIWLYTFKGGVKTIVFTDTLQTACMLGGLVLCCWYMASELLPLLSQKHSSSGIVSSTFAELSQRNYLRMWNTDANSAAFWAKQLLGGVMIALAMVGLDQEMMQKNISVPNLRDSQKNMVLFSFVLLGVNVLFLVLGGLLSIYASAFEVKAAGDQLFPTVMSLRFPAWLQLVFFVALISALFPSADGALTALTSSFCNDILRLRDQSNRSDAEVTRTRHFVHIGFTLVFFALVMIFKAINDRSIIDTILRLATYTYGPLAGLFAFGMFSSRALPRVWAMIAACAASPVLCYSLVRWFALDPKGYQIGLELMLINAALTYALLWIGSKRLASA
jgi:Na+/proline symporter